MVVFKKLQEDKDSLMNESDGKSHLNVSISIFNFTLSVSFDESEAKEARKAKKEERKTKILILLSSFCIFGSLILFFAALNLAIDAGLAPTSSKVEASPTRIKRDVMSMLFPRRGRTEVTSPSSVPSTGRNSEVEDRTDSDQSETVTETTEGNLKFLMT